MNDDALHVDLEHPVARPAGLALLAALAVAGFAQGLTPKLWSDLSIHQVAPAPTGDNVARPLIEDPTPPVLAIAPRAATAQRREAAKPVEEVAAPATLIPTDAAAAGQDAAALAPPPAEAAPQEVRGPAEIGEPVPLEPPEAPAEPAEPPSY